MLRSEGPSATPMTMNPTTWGMPKRWKSLLPRKETAMREAVIVEALRSPIARGKLGRGGLSGLHPVKLLARLQQAVVERSGLDPK